MNTTDEPTFGPKNFTLREVAETFYIFGRDDAANDQAGEDLPFVSRGYSIGGIPLDAVREEYARRYPKRVRSE